MAPPNKSTPTTAAPRLHTSQGGDFPDLPKNLDRRPSPSPTPSQSPSPPIQEPDLSQSGSGSADVGDLGDDFTKQGQETQQPPRQETLDPELITAEQFQARFASWFDAPAEILAGNPSPEFRDRAARALHAEISNSKNEWFRALAKRGTGTAGNWMIILGFGAALIKGMADSARAAAMQQAGQPAGGNAGAPEGGQAHPFRDVDMSGKP